MSRLDEDVFEILDQQARDFCEKWQVKITKEFLYHGSRTFCKEERDLYRVTIETPTHKWNCIVGNPLFVTYDRETGMRIPLTDNDVLFCLDKEGPGSFKRFCERFRLPADGEEFSKQIKWLIYRRKRKEWNNIRRAFSAKARADLRLFST